MTNTQEKGRNKEGAYVNYLLAPTRGILNAPGGAIVDSTSPWKNYVAMCDNLPTPPTNTPPVHGCDIVYKGFWTLGYTQRNNDFSPESPCGGFGLCTVYENGPMKVGYLYGYAGDPNQGFVGQSMAHTLQLESVGGCKLQLTGNLPYSPGFTQMGSPAPTDYINSRIPSDTYIFLDGGRAVRIKLNTWFAMLTDVCFPNVWWGSGLFLNGNIMDFKTNSFVSGPDTNDPYWSAGMSYSSQLANGTIVWGSTMQHVGCNNFHQMRWFDDNQKNPVKLDMIVRTWYYIPQPPSPAPLIDDPVPDPWSIGIDEYVKAQTGCRPPDECIFVPGSLVRTCIASGDEIFQVPPTYTDSPGFTWGMKVSMDKTKWFHICYYTDGVLVGQRQWYNSDAGATPSSYNEYLTLLFQNYLTTGTQGEIYPSNANFCMYPYGALGEDQFPFATMNLMSRSGTTMTFTPVYPTNMSDGKGGFLKAEVHWGDGSATVQVPPLVVISHTFPASGQYPVSISFDGKASTTNFLTG